MVEDSGKAVNAKSRSSYSKGHSVANPSKGKQPMPSTSKVTWVSKAHSKAKGTGGKVQVNFIDPSVAELIWAALVRTGTVPDPV